MNAKQYFVYILTNYKNTVLYTGVTNNLKIRVYSHRNKIGSLFTTKYNINKLVYYEVFTDIVSAISREKQIKNLLRSKKESLINNFNSSWKDLYFNL